MFFPVLSTTSPPSRFRSPSSSLPQVGSPYFSAWQWCRGVVLVLAQVGNGEPFIHRKYIGNKNRSQQRKTPLNKRILLLLITCHSSWSKNSVLWLVISSPGSCFSDSHHLPSSPIISHHLPSKQLSRILWVHLVSTWDYLQRWL